MSVVYGGGASRRAVRGKGSKRAAHGAPNRELTRRGLRLALGPLTPRHRHTEPVHTPRGGCGVRTRLKEKQRVRMGVLAKKRDRRAVCVCVVALHIDRTERTRTPPPMHMPGRTHVLHVHGPPHDPHSLQLSTPFVAPRMRDHASLFIARGAGRANRNPLALHGADRRR